MFLRIVATYGAQIILGVILSINLTEIDTRISIFISKAFDTDSTIAKQSAIVFAVLGCYFLLELAFRVVFFNPFSRGWIDGRHKEKRSLSGTWLEFYVAKYGGDTTYLFVAPFSLTPSSESVFSDEEITLAMRGHAFAVCTVESKWKLNDIAEALNSFEEPRYVGTWWSQDLAKAGTNAWHYVYDGTINPSIDINPGPAERYGTGVVTLGDHNNGKGYFVSHAGEFNKFSIVRIQKKHWKELSYTGSLDSIE